MVYDCFTFFNELDLLEIRLNILNDYVDKFVIVEATRTHANKPKDLVFQNNKKRFSAFMDKIIYVIADDFPEFETAWTNESYQRNCIMNGLKNCNDDDIIIISDLDEIWNPLKTDLSCNHGEVIGIRNQNFMFYLNYCNYGLGVIDKSRMIRFSFFKEKISDKLLPSVGTFSKSGDFTEITPNLIRSSKPHCIKGDGWHFTYVGGIERVKLKMSSFAHQEYNKPEIVNDVFLKKQIDKGRFSISISDCILNRLFVIKVDERLPKYIQENTEKYSNLILPCTKEKKISQFCWKSTWKLRRKLVNILVGCKPLMYIKNFIFPQKNGVNQ